MLSSLKAHILDAYAGSLQAQEISFLRERQYTLKDNGELAEQSMQLTFAKNAKFTFRILKRLAPDLNVDLELGGPDWEALMRALKVRHRLTHPKTLSDLVVTDEEYEATAVGCMWFMRRTHDIPVQQLMEKLRAEIQSRESVRSSAKKHSSPKRYRKLK